MNGFYQSDRRLLATMKADDRLTITDFRVMLAAMENTKLPGDAVALGIDFLANGTRISSRAIVRSRQHLVELGYLVPSKTGQRGLSYFTVTTPDAAFTDSGVTDAVFTDATFMGTYERGVIGTHDASVIQMDTGNIETTTYAPNSEKPPSCSMPATTKTDTSEPPFKEPTDSRKLESVSLAQGTATPPQSPSPDTGGKAKAPKARAAKITWDGARYYIPDHLLTSYREAFPCVDIEMVAKRAAAWRLSNSRKAPKSNFARHLNYWFSNVKAGDPEYIDPDEQAVSDAELIRLVKQTFDDPAEQADYWHECKSRGEYVPLGVECRPMPGKMEVAQ